MLRVTKQTLYWKIRLFFLMKIVILFFSYIAILIIMDRNISVLSLTFT